LQLFHGQILYPIVAIVKKIIRNYSIDYSCMAAKDMLSLVRKGEMMEDKALIPFADIRAMATVMGKSMMFGKTPEQLLPLMLLAQAEGRHPASVAMDYDVIQGKPAINSRASLGRYQTSGGKIEWKERTDTKCVAIFTHPASGSVEISWDIERAKLAKIYDKPQKDGGPNMWHKYPAQMLSARVIAEGVRASYPACLSGMYLVEEVQDFDAPRNVTPDVEEMQSVADSMGNLAPEVDPGEPAKRGDGIASAMLALKTRLMNCNASDVFNPDERKDITSDYHPGGRNLTNSQNDLDYLKGIVEKWETLRDFRKEKAIADMDAEASAGFDAAMGNE
jgi:hypothetical protein